MMRAVQVVLRDALPVHLIWNRKKLPIAEIHDRWQEQGRWWDGEDPAEFFLASTSSGMFLLAKNLTTLSWSAKPVQ